MVWQCRAGRPVTGHSAGWDLLERSAGRDSLMTPWCKVLIAATAGALETGEAPMEKAEEAPAEAEEASPEAEDAPEEA